MLCFEPDQISTFMIYYPKVERDNRAFVIEFIIANMRVKRIARRDRGA